MGKYTRKKEKKSGIKIAALIVCGLVLTAVLILYVMPRVLYSLSGEAETQVTEQNELLADTIPAETTGETIPGVEYPVELEDGRLILTSLFQFEGLNPDSNMESGNDIASVTLQNVSGDFLAEARLALELADGSTVEFHVTNLPAGREVMAFAVDNTQLDGDWRCVAVSCDAVWSTMAEAMPEAVTAVADGMTITVTNNTAQEILALTVYCRDPLDESYFGGKAQEYIVNNLPANGTVTAEALDSFLGLPEVVCVVIHE